MSYGCNCLERIIYEENNMLFISIMLVIWFGFWLFFAYQRHIMLQIITNIMIESVESQEDED